MSYLTPDRAIAARESLSLSQSLVARETGIARSYLSQFENSKRVLEDSQLEELNDYYMSQGWTPSEESMKQSPEQLINSGKHGLTIADGFVVCQYPAANGYIVEDLLDAYYENSQLIHDALNQKLERGFFGGLDEEEALKDCLRPLLLMARQYEIKQILSGQYTKPSSSVTPSDSSTVQTVGDYLEVLMMARIPNRHPQTQDELEKAV